MSPLPHRVLQRHSLRCPRCQITLDRIHRSVWMRFLPFSQHLHCPRCEQRYLRLLRTCLGPL